MHVNVIQFGFDHVKIAIQIYFDDIPIVGHNTCPNQQL